MELASRTGYLKGRRGRRRIRNGETLITDRRVTQIGVIVRGTRTGSEAPWHITGQLLAGMSGEARELDASLHIHYVASSDQADQLHDPAFQPVMLAKGDLDGVILIGSLPVQFVRTVSQSLPCVSIVDRVPGVTLDCIDHDDADSVSQLVERMVSLGHERIGFICGTAVRSVYAARYAGLVQAVLLRGLPFSTDDAINIRSQGREIAQVAPLVHERIKAGVTGWIAAHDVVGYELMAGLARRGMHAPSDYSIAGFDNLAGPSGDLPRLASIQAPFTAMGAAAVRAVMRRIRRPESEILHSMFHCKLIEGETLGRQSER